MKSKPPQHVQLAISKAIHHSVQTRLQAECDAQGMPGALDPATLRALRVRHTRAHYVGRKNHIHYIAVLIQFSDGLSYVVRWRVPDSVRSDLKGGMQYPHTWGPILDKDASMHTLTGARAGSGGPAEATKGARPRSRPEIGRARKRSGRQPGGNSKSDGASRSAI